MKKIFLTALLVAVMSSSTVFAADMNLNFGTTQTPFVYHAGQRCEAKATFVNDIEARAGAAFVKKASSFKSKIQLEYKDKVINARSLMKLMGLGLYAGSEVTIIAEGDDAQQAVDTLKEFIEAGCPAAR